MYPDLSIAGCEVEAGEVTSLVELVKQIIDSG